MEDVTFIILTLNEEVNLPGCLRSIRGFAKRVVVVDSGSTDRTIEIARRMGADVYEHPFENYARQFNWAIDHTEITTKWTFRLDADERLTGKLMKELSHIMRMHAEDDVNGAVMEAWLIFMGRRIRHGAHNKRKLMLFRTGKGRIEDRRMDEHTVLSEGRAVTCRERFIHHDFKDMSHWIRKMNWYATREMQDYISSGPGEMQDYISSCLGEMQDYISSCPGKMPGEEEQPCIKNKATERFGYSCGTGEKTINGTASEPYLGTENDRGIARTRRNKYGIYYKFPMFIRCRLLFIYYYFFRLGFLDGREGYIFHYMYHMWYRTLVDAKILEQRKSGRPFEKTGELR